MPPPPLADAAPARRLRSKPGPSTPPPLPPIPPPPPPAAPKTTLEERFGTQWVVWIGGPRARARRRFPRALRGRAGSARPRRAHLPRRAVRGGPDRGRRMDAARRNRQLVLPPCPAGISRACSPPPAPSPPMPPSTPPMRSTISWRRRRLHFARTGGAGDARRRAAARAGAGGPGPRRRFHRAAAGLHQRAELLGALSLSRGRHRRGLRAGAHETVALACHHRGRARRALGAAGHFLPARRRHSARISSMSSPALRLPPP